MKAKYKSTTKHLSRDEIIRLAKSSSSNDAVKKAMLHIKHCEFCNEAFKGISQLPDPGALYTLNAQWKLKTGLKKNFKKLEINLNVWYVLLLLIGLISLVIIYFFFFLQPIY